MSKFFKGDVTNGVVEFNLLDPAVGAGGTTATVVTKNTGANEVLKIVGDIPASYASTEGIGGTAKGLVIGTSCTSIGSYAFYYCAGLTGELVIPNSVTSIGSYAFHDCTGLTGDLVIPDSVTNIGDAAFAAYGGSHSFSNIIIGNGVTSIGSNAFYSITTYDKLIIGDSVTSIGNYAFGYNTITSVYAACPASSWVGSNAFYTASVTTLYAKDAVANGYTLGSQSFEGTTLTVADWTNYPNIP